MAEHGDHSGILGRREMFDVDTGLTAFLKAEIIASRSWSTLIFEQNIRGADPQALADACARAGYSTAVCLDIDEGVFETINIELDIEGIRGLRKAFLSPSFAVIEAEERFIITSDADFYWTIAGERSFVESIFDLPWNVLLDGFERGIEPYRSSPDGFAVLTQVWRNMTAYVALCRSSFAER